MAHYTDTLRDEQLTSYTIPARAVLADYLIEHGHAQLTFAYGWDPTCAFPQSAEFPHGFYFRIAPRTPEDLGVAAENHIRALAENDPVLGELLDAALT